MRDNIDYFNEAVGLIFSDLYSAFPKRIAVDPRGIAERMGVQLSFPEPPKRPDLRLSPIDDSPRFATLDTGVEFEAMLKSTKQWLQDEGFIRGGDGEGRGQFQLTAKALTAMNATPQGLSEPLGSKLSAAVKATGSDTRRAVICEVVGQILGAATKGLGF
jgi:hypothetical protein